MASVTNSNEVIKSRVRKETTRMRPETNSREAKMQMLVACGLGNGAIWSALEEEYPQIIEDPKRRYAVAGKNIDYDKEERARVGRALNSTRALAIKDDERVMSIIEATGGNDVDVKRVDEMDMMNRHRFSWGIKELDDIYGKTKFVHLTDHPNSKYEEKSRIINVRDEEGNVTPTHRTSQVWVKGMWRAGDPMIPNGDGGFIRTRNSDGKMDVSEIDSKRQIIEYGCPEAFMSIWGGSPGVGKTRLAIAAGKMVSEVTREPILYINGEATEDDFRGWVGHDVDPELFNVLSTTMIPVQRVCDLAHRIRPRVIFIDSVQTLAEWDKGNRGQKSALTILKHLKADKSAGNPHIVLISQLNKKDQLKGSRDLEHLVDMVSLVTKVEGKKGIFLFSCDGKNRGGETGKSALFKHTDLSIVALASASKPASYNLKVPSPTPAISAGVVDAPGTTIVKVTSEEAE